MSLPSCKCRSISIVKALVTQTFNNEPSKCFNKFRINGLQRLLDCSLLFRESDEYRRLERQILQENPLIMGAPWVFLLSSKISLLVLLRSWGFKVVTKRRRSGHYVAFVGASSLKSLTLTDVLHKKITVQVQASFELWFCKSFYNLRVFVSPFPLNKNIKLLCFCPRFKTFVLAKEIKDKKQEKTF